MPITSSTTRNFYTASAGQTVFTGTFKIVKSTDLKVYINAVLKTEGTHYNLSGVGSANFTVTLTSGAAAGDSVAVMLDPILDQQAQYKHNDKFPERTHQDIVDRLTLMALTLSEKIGRSLKFGKFSSVNNIDIPDPEANKILRWKSDLSGMENVSAGQIPVGVLGDVTPAVVSKTGTPGVSPDISRRDHSHTLDAFVESTVAGLPAAATSGRIRRVTDDARGLWLDMGSKWFPISGGHFDVREFGAKGDDSTNDTAAIQAAIDAAAAQGGGTVLIPSNGVFRISQITLKGRVSLTGTVGRRATLKSVNSNASNVMIINDNTSFWCRITNLLIDGNKANQTNAVQGIHLFAGASQETVFSLDNLTVQNCKGDGIQIDSGANFLLDNWILDNDGNGIVINTNAADNALIGQHVGHSGKNGIVLKWAANWISASKVFQSGFGSGGIGTGAGPGDGVQILFGGNRIEGLEVQDNSRHGIYIAPTGNNYGGHIEAQFDGGTAGTVGSAVALQGADYWVIRGNAIGLVGAWDHIVNFLDGNCNKNDIDLQYAMPGGGQDALQAGHTAVNGDPLDNRVVVGPRAVWAQGSVTGTYAVDADAREMHELSLTGNITITISGGHRGAVLDFIFIQDATGGRTVTWPGNIRKNWTPDTTANKINTIKLFYDGTNWIQVAQTIGA